MKTKTSFILSMGFLLALVCGKLSAQSTEKTGETKTVNSTQAVINSAVTNANVLVMTGRIVDAQTKLPITNAKINFDKFGDELLQASIDEKGNYALALNKDELGEPIRIIFRIKGYKKYTIKAFDKKMTYVDADIMLEPMDSEEKSNAQVKYTMNSDPFNPLVIKLE